MAVAEGTNSFRRCGCDGVGTFNFKSFEAACGPAWVKVDVHVRFDSALARRRELATVLLGIDMHCDGGAGIQGMWGITDRDGPAAASTVEI